MKPKSPAFGTASLQIIGWMAVLLIVFFSYLPQDSFYQASCYAFITVFFYILIIYGNINFLFPRFYAKGHVALYMILVVFFLSVIGIARGYLLNGLYNRFFTSKPEPIRVEQIINIIVTCFLTFLLSFIFRIALAYFSLKQQSEKILVQKTEAELNLLKSQVQPHFLFNTLNNIYYEIYRQAPAGAALIGRLSDIMRYFVDESPKERVLLSAEIQFLENYIELEKIRIRYPIVIDFSRDADPRLLIPPMLLMTFVENLFKHGIDKSNPENKVTITLTEKDGYLIFNTKNRSQGHAVPGTGGFGIANLRK